MAKKLPPGHKLRRQLPPPVQRSGAAPEFVFALDDSGPTAPILDKHGKFSKVAQPFTIIGGLAMNKVHVESFATQWNALRAEIQLALDCDTLPALHARLMFGKSPEDRPKTYRERPNPYRRASAEQVIDWYLKGMEIIGSVTRQPLGGNSFSVTFVRQQVCSGWEDAFACDAARAEAEFLKVFRRRKHPKLFDRYIAAVTSVFTMPTLDAYFFIEEILNQNRATGTLLLDPYSDALAFDDAAAFSFIAEHLRFTRITSSRRIPDIDEEPLLQAADLLAYTEFRHALFRERQKTEPSKLLEPFFVEGHRLVTGPPLFSRNTVQIITRAKSTRSNRALYSAARYAIAHHLLCAHEKEGETVREFFKSPEEFMDACKAIYRHNNPSSASYLPILKDGILERWEASGRSDAFNGEDHP